jgi:hypothetical protein
MVVKIGKKIERELSPTPPSTAADREGFAQREERSQNCVGVVKKADP